MTDTSTEELLQQGFSLQGQHDHVEAIAIFRMILQEDENPSAIGGLAYSQRASGDMVSALESYQRLLKIEPNWAEV